MSPDYDNLFFVDALPEMELISYMKLTEYNVKYRSKHYNTDEDSLDFPDE